MGVEVKVSIGILATNPSSTAATLDDVRYGELVGHPLNTLRGKIEVAIPAGGPSARNLH